MTVASFATHLAPTNSSHSSIRFHWWMGSNGVKSSVSCDELSDAAPIDGCGELMPKLGDRLGAADDRAAGI